ncbi:MAG TPA: tetratricopeptide repeat protein [Candidatus Krumholzibacteria bacterium]|nr:tetratricopeptide repeat protein [Candidatus Krumholzibacteria bacterium]
MTRRLAALSLLALVLAGGCAKQQWQESHRLETLRDEQRYTLQHTVAPGETLRGVAELYYGDPERAQALALANGVSDPDLIRPGDTVVLEFDEDEWRRAETRRDAMAPYNQGVEALRLGRLRTAEEAFHQALTVDPDFRDAQYNLALVWLRRGRYEDAEAMLLPLRDRDPDDADVALAYGQSLFHQARFAEAVAEFDRLLARRPDHTEAAFSRASALGADGRTAEARAAWRAFLQRHGDDDWGARARVRLRDLESGGGTGR